MSVLSFQRLVSNVACLERSANAFSVAVILAHAGIQFVEVIWIPAFAGMTAKTNAGMTAN
jgi:hypothetical protein